MNTEAYFLDQPGEPLARRSLALDEPGAGEVLVEVAACGLCHTDLSFADGSVQLIHENIDINVFRALATRSGGETNQEF